MKLEVGMYVRTKYGIIEKIEDVLEFDGTDYYLNSFHTAVKLDKETNVAGSKGKVIKASYNIIDLIEKGDLLEIEFFSPRYQERVIRLFEADYVENKTIRLTNSKCVLNIFNGEWSNEDSGLEPIIKLIVTKEQFNQIAYVVDKEGK